MSKAILVMDMPECCYQCPCFSITECRAYKCGTKVEDDRKKPNWCPLKTLPNPIDVSGCKTEITKARAQEYNALLAKLSN